MVSTIERPSTFDNPILSVDSFQLVEKKVQEFEDMFSMYLKDPEGRILVYANTHFDPAQMPSSIVFGIHLTITSAGMRIGISQFLHGVRGSGSYHQSKDSALEYIRKSLRYFYRETPFRRSIRAVGVTAEYGFSIIDWEV
jgi:hypothetical protein